MSYADWMATGSNLKFPKNTANREWPKNSSSQKRVDAVSFPFVKLITNQWNVKFRKKELIYLDSVTETVNKSHLLHRLIPTMIWRKVEQLNRTLVANQKHCASAIKKITTITLCGHCLDSELMIINQQESSWAFSGNMTYINILLNEPSNTAKMRRRKAKND